MFEQSPSGMFNAAIFVPTGIARQPAPALPHSAQDIARVSVRCGEVV